MSASSLIFVVIFAVWGAYMLKHWVRRREDLATARSVDRFSEAMRMLERRTPVKADVSPRHENAVRPALLRRQSNSSVQPPEGDQANVSGATSVSAVGGRQSGRLKASAAGAGRLLSGSRRVSLTSPEAKLGVLLTAVGFFVLTLVLAPFGAVPGWLPLLGLLAVGGTFVWLRRSAVKSRAARAGQSVAPARPVAAAQSVREAKPTDTAAKQEGTAPREVVAQNVEPQPKRSPLVAERVTASKDVVFDQGPDMNAVARAQAQVFDAGWAPVDVPRPTYTMKAKAERAQVAPAATTPVDARPLAARYENTPVAELPFDGMALDEDYEELPQVYRAG